MGLYKYINVKVIEDKAGLLNNGIRIHESYAINEPLDIQQIEYWESRLDKLNIPYVLAEVTLRSANGGPSDTGYVIFTNMDYMKPFTKEYA